MAKPFNFQIRWSGLLLARALFLAISIVLSSSGEDVQPFDTTERSNLSSNRRLRQARGIAMEPIANPRVLHSKSAKAKSAKVGSKSKSAKWGKGEGKAEKSKGAKFSKSKGAKSKSEWPWDKAGKADAESISSDRSKAGKGEKLASEESISSSDSVESFHSKSLDDLESESLDAATTKNIQVPTEEEISVVTQSESMDTSSVYYDSVGVERGPGMDSVHSPFDDMEDTETASPTDAMINTVDVASIEDAVHTETAAGVQATSTSEGSIPPESNGMDEAGHAQYSQNVDEHNTVESEGETAIQTASLEVESEFMEERIHGEDMDAIDRNVSLEDSSTQEQTVETSNDKKENGIPSSDEIMTEEAPTLESEVIEERIAENEEDFEHLNEEEVELDPSMESVE